MSKFSVLEICQKMSAKENNFCFGWQQIERRIELPGTKSHESSLHYLKLTTQFRHFWVPIQCTLK